MIANTPAKGPKPTIITNKIAQSIEGKVRVAASRARIGFYIINYIKFFEYGKAAVFMLVVLVTVLIIDWVSVRIRDKYIVKSQRGMQVKA